MIDYTFVNQLKAVSTSNEGASLNRTDMEEENFVRSFIERIINEIRPRTILETGTNKCMFGYIVMQYCYENKIEFPQIYTFDIAAWSNDACKLVSEYFHTDNIHFTHGPTVSTLVNWYVNPGIDLAFIDGGHNSTDANFDCSAAVRIGAKHILVDDMGTVEVEQAANKHLSASYELIRREKIGCADMALYSLKGVAA